MNPRRPRRQPNGVAKADAAGCSLHDEFAEPERGLLETVLRDHAVAASLARAAGGWRTLSAEELEHMALGPRIRESVLALQELVGRGYEKLPAVTVQSSEVIGRIYGKRLAGLTHEVLLGVALDGRNHLIGEVELAVGGAHGLTITPRDVFRPLVRMGASAFVLVHNHPSGNPAPSHEDVMMTRAVAAVGDIVGIPLVDHVVVAAREGGFASLLDLGLFPERDEP